MVEKRKKLTEKDLKTLRSILGNVTVTKSGMLRTSNFVLLPPDTKDLFIRLVEAVEKQVDETKKMSAIMELFIDALKNPPVQHQEE